MAENWSVWVLYVFAHEYHHAVWGYNYHAIQQKSTKDLPTGLLIDGEVDTFAKLLYPELQPSWINALTPSEEAEQRNWVQETNYENLIRNFFICHLDRFSYDVRIERQK
jgi:hypothetical protein